VENIGSAQPAAACFRCLVSEGEVLIAGEIEAGRENGEILVNGTATLTPTKPTPPSIA
jgi:hypothetical protein